MERIKEFINSIEVENTAKVVKHVLGDVEEKIENYTKSELEKFVLDKQPDSYRAIVTICYVIGAYAKWLDKNYPFEGNTLLELVNSIDKKQLWKKIKPTARKKFVTYHDLKRVIKDESVKELKKQEEQNNANWAMTGKCILVVGIIILAFIICINADMGPLGMALLLIGSVVLGCIILMKSSK